MSAVAIIGMGSLGTVVAQLLCYHNVSVQLYDFDVVETKNLVRQSLYCSDDVGTLKVDAAKKALLRLFPNADISSFALKVDDKTISSLQADVIVDCTDVLAMRHLINRYCLSSGIPWVHGAAAGHLGQVALFTPSMPCYSCVFGDSSIDRYTCDGEGIDVATSQLVGLLQVASVLQCLNGVFSPSFFRVNLHSSSFFQRLSFVKDPACSACGSASSVKRRSFTLELCRTKGVFKTVLCDPSVLDLQNIASKVSFSVKSTADSVLVLHVEQCGEVEVYRHGEIFFNTCKNTKLVTQVAEQIYS